MKELSNQIPFWIHHTHFYCCLAAYQYTHQNIARNLKVQLFSFCIFMESFFTGQFLIGNLTPNLYGHIL